MGRVPRRRAEAAVGGRHAGHRVFRNQRHGRVDHPARALTRPFDPEDRVARYWPEFAQNGKGNITVRQLLSHQAGLALLDDPIDLDTARDPDRLAEILAAQKPAWEPGTRHGYHAITIGFDESELLRRIDPLGVLGHVADQ